MAAINKFGVTSTLVSNSIGFAELSSSSDPTSTQVDLWITQFSAMLNSAMEAVGVTAADITSSTDEVLYELCKQLIVARTAAQWTSSNQREVSEYSQLAIDEFDRFISEIRSHTSHRLSTTGHGMSLKSDILTTPTNTVTRWLTKTNGFK